MILAEHEDDPKQRRLTVDNIENFLYFDIWRKIVTFSRRRRISNWNRRRGQKEISNVLNQKNITYEPSCLILAAAIRDFANRNNNDTIGEAKDDEDEAAILLSIGPYER